MKMKKDISFKIKLTVIALIVAVIPIITTLLVHFLYKGNNNDSTETSNYFGNKNQTFNYSLSKNLKKNIGRNSIIKNESSTSIKLPYIGIRNPSMLCYMISVIQMVYVSPALRSYVTDIEIDDSSSHINNNLNEIIRELKNLFKAMDKGSKEDGADAVNLESLANAISRDWPDIKNSKGLFIASDASEFLSKLMSYLGNPDNQKYQEISIFRPKNSSFFNHYVKSTSEPFFLQHKTIYPHSSSGSELDLMSLLVGNPENECERKFPGIGLQKCIETSVYTKLPKVFIINVNRASLQNTKLNTTLKYKEEMVLTQVSDLSDLQRSSKNFTFELRGVVVHKGSMSFGHYYSYVKSPILNDSWVKFDDASTPKLVPPKSVFDDNFGGKEVKEGPTASILYYQRKSM